jgi:carboxypeptidase family protein
MMLKKTFARVIWLVGIGILPADALAQSAISGLVNDQSGAVLPGVTIEATSAALIEQARTAVTDSQGRYTIVDLRPGAYKVTFTLPGFSTVIQDGINLPSNFTATVNATLAVGALNETVTVSGQSPIVDLQSARRTSSLNREQIDTLPTARTYASLGALVVGVKVSEQNVGGARGALQQRLTVHGSLSKDTTVAVDGMKMNTMAGDGDSMPDHNDAMTQEVTVQVSALGAEVSSGGVHMNLVPRDGGNVFSGALYAGYTDGSFQSNNLTPELLSRGLRVPDSTELVYDINPFLGGPLRRDRLWFFGSFRSIGSDNIVANSFYPDGRPGIYDQTVKNYTLRLTWQATPKNKITAYDDYQVKFVGHEFVSGEDVLTGAWRREPVLKYTGAVKWTSTPSNRWLVDAAYGASANNAHRQYQAGVEKARGTPEWYATASRQDIVRGTRTTAAVNSSMGYNTRHVIMSSASYVTGSHAVKTGVQWHFGPTRSIISANADLVQRYRDGVPDSVIAYNTPTSAYNRMNADLGIYVQDTWTIKRFTLTPGVRYEYFNSSIQEQSVDSGRFVPARDFAKVPDVPNWRNVAPRFGIVYDLTGDARTAVKFGLNKYHRNYTDGFASRYNALSLQSDTRNWFDCDLAPGTTTCSTQVLPTNRDNIAQDNEIGPSNNLRFGEAPARRADPDVKRAYDLEYSLGIDRQVGANIAVAAAWYRRETYHRERQDNLLIDVGDYSSFQAPSPLNGEPITIYNLNRAKQGLVDILDTTPTDHRKNRQLYNGFELGFTMRLPKGNALMGGWSADQLINVACDGDNPNTFRYCDESILDIPFRHDFKFAGSYQLPLDLQLGATLQSYAGRGLTVSWAVPATLFPGGRTEALTVALIPPGSNYLKRWNQLDLSLRKLFRVGKVRLDGNIDFYNALNSNVVVVENQNFGSSLGSPQQVLQARILRLSVQVRF